MTDTVIQFTYSDSVHMVALYIKSDTHQDLFIPFLNSVVEACESANLHRGWDYVVAKMTSLIVDKHTDQVKFILESQIEPTTCCFKYTVTIDEDIYRGPFINIVEPPIKKKLKDYVKISCDTFNGLLKDFNTHIINESKEYEIQELEQEIQELTLRLNTLKLS